MKRKKIGRRRSGAVIARRDAAARAALTGLLARMVGEEFERAAQGAHGARLSLREWVAASAYKYADALEEAR